MSHHCHARDCNSLVAPELLMCAPHWRAVPRSIQRAVYKAYRHGQCDDKKPSEAWLRASTAAIGMIALREGKRLRTVEARELLRRGFRVSIVREYVKRLGEEQRGSIEATLDNMAAESEKETAAE
jgi:hypothetical protein